MSLLVVHRSRGRSISLSLTLTTMKTSMKLTFPRPYWVSLHQLASSNEALSSRARPWSCLQWTSKNPTWRGFPTLLRLEGFTVFWDQEMSSSCRPSGGTRYSLSQTKQSGGTWLWIFGKMSKYNACNMTTFAIIVVHPGDNLSYNF